MIKDKEIVSATFNYGKVKEASEIENTFIDSINIEKIAKPPESITKAIKLIYLSAGIQILNNLVFHAQTDGAQILINIFVSLIIAWFFASMIRKKKNWARVTFIILTVFGSLLIFSSASMVLKFAGQAAGLVIFLAQFVNLVAVYQLIKDDSSKWTKYSNEIPAERNSEFDKRIVSTEFNVKTEVNPSKNFATDSGIESMKKEPKL